MTVYAFLISLGLTLLLELPFAYVWGLRSRHNLTLAALVNVLTNPAAVLLHGLGFPALAVEAAAIAVEGACYRFRGENLKHPFQLTLWANVFSYSVGCLLNDVI